MYIHIWKKTTPVKTHQRHHYHMAMNLCTCIYLQSLSPTLSNLEHDKNESIYIYREFKLFRSPAKDGGLAHTFSPHFRTSCDEHVHVHIYRCMYIRIPRPKQYVISSQHSHPNMYIYSVGNGTGRSAGERVSSPTCRRCRPHCRRLRTLICLSVTERIRVGDEFS